MNRIAILLLAIIIVGCVCLETTLSRMAREEWWANLTTPSEWYPGADCDPIDVAIPGAYIDSRGVIQLPARTIYIGRPVCEFFLHNIVGQGADKTVLHLEKEKK
jgi:hypothetical protein